MNDWPYADMEALAKKAECFETPEWAVEAILDVELMTSAVIDPCCGRGVLSEAAKSCGHDVRAIDLYDWGYGRTDIDFLGRMILPPVEPFTVLMNPPFSLAQAFVEKAKEMGARKIICFQRFAWWEGSRDTGKKRGQWWEKHRPNRIYICGDRADCWRVDIPPEERTSSSPTAHAWFVWEQGQPQGPLVGQIYKKRPSC